MKVPTHLAESKARHSPRFNKDAVTAVLHVFLSPEMNEMNPERPAPVPSGTLVSGAADLLATAAWGGQLRSPQCLGGDCWTLVQTTTMSGLKLLGSGLGWSKCKESKRSDTERSAHWQDFTDSEFRGNIYEHVNIFSHSFHRFCVICMPWKSLIYTDLVTSGFVLWPSNTEQKHMRFSWQLIHTRLVKHHDLIWPDSSVNKHVQPVCQNESGWTNTVSRHLKLFPTQFENCICLLIVLKRRVCYIQSKV